jgi:hypothetical protein
VLFCTNLRRVKVFPWKLRNEGGHAAQNSTTYLGGTFMSRYRVTNITSPAESLRLAEAGGKLISNGESVVVPELTDGIQGLVDDGKVTAQLLSGGEAQPWAGIPVNAQTEDATPTVAASLETAENKAYIMKAFVVAIRTGGAAGTANDSAAYELTYAVYNKAGTLTVTELGRNENEDQAGFEAEIVANGAVAELQVTGAADNEVNWSGELEFFEA